MLRSSFRFWFDERKLSRCFDCWGRACLTHGGRVSGRQRVVVVVLIYIYIYICRRDIGVSHACVTRDIRRFLWSLTILADVPAADARTATLTLARKQRFIAPCEIIAEVRMVRAERLAVVAIPAANCDPDDPAWIAEHRAIVKAIADGHMPDPAAYAASGRTITGATPKPIGAKTGRKVTDLILAITGRRSMNSQYPEFSPEPSPGAPETSFGYPAATQPQKSA